MSDNPKCPNCDHFLSWCICKNPEKEFRFETNIEWRRIEETSMGELIVPFATGEILDWHALIGKKGKLVFVEEKKQ